MRYVAVLTTILCLLALTSFIQADDNFYLCQLYARVNGVGKRNYQSIYASFETVIRDILTSDPATSGDLERLQFLTNDADVVYTTAESAEAGMALLNGSTRARNAVLDAINTDSGTFEGYMVDLIFRHYGTQKKYCIAIPSTCFNGQLDGDETDVDCGGGSCLRCSTGQSCLVDDDCLYGICEAEYDGAPLTCAESANSSFVNFQMYFTVAMTLLGLLFVVM